MFCEKCGNQIPDGSTFCEKCGAPTGTVNPAQEQVNTTPEQTAPEAQQQVQPQQAPEAQQQVQPQQAFQQAPKAPKAPLSPLMKKIIIFGSIGVAVVAAFLIVLFTVIIPNVNKPKEEKGLDISKYYTISISGIPDEEETTESSDDDSDSDKDKDKDKDNKRSVVDGRISGQFNWDYKKLAKDKDITEEKAKDIFSNICSYSYMSVDVKMDDKSVGSSFSEASTDTEFEVTIKWNTLTDEERKAISLSGGDLSTLDPLEQVKKLEKDYGVVFNHENSTTKIKMSDVLEEKNISIKEAVELDVLGYIEKNDVIKQDGKINGNISVILGEFETTINGYKVRNGYEGSKNIYVLDSDNKNLVSFYLEIENDSSLSDGDTATITYDNYYKESALDAGFKLVGDDIKFTVKGGEALTADTAKNHVNEIKAYFNEAVKEEDSLSRDTDTLELKNIYFCSNNSENRIVCVYNNVTKKFFKTFYFSTNKVSIADGKLVNEGNADDSLSYKTIDEAVKNSRYLNGKNNFTVTKLL